MSTFDYDLFTIGAGSGGVRASRLAAASGRRVAVAEEHRIGGTCVIRGCVPKKLLSYGAEYGQIFEDARGYGWSAEGVRFDWPTLRDNIQAEVSRLSGIYRANLAKAGAELIEERAEIVGPHEVRLASGRRVTAERILVATGGRAVRPAGMTGEELVITSDEAFTLDRVPERAIIVGGGYIALEFASVFLGLGAAVTVVVRGDGVLRGFDDDVRRFVQDEMTRCGMRLIVNARPLEVVETGNGRRMRLTNDETVDGDLVMFAIGRAPNTIGVGLEAAGVKLAANGAVVVDAYSQSSVPSIWAIGDATDRLNLTPVAIREGQAFFETVFMGRPTAVDHANVPTAVFGRPYVGVVGMTELEARMRYGVIDVYRATFRPMRNIIAKNDQRWLMKLVVRAADDVILGVHMVGTEAPELAQLAAVAVKAGLTKAQWDATIALHPTVAEELVLLREKAPPSAI